jgi:hypothetical protein
VIAGLLLLSPLALAAQPRDYTLSCAFKNPDGKVFRIIDYHLSGSQKFRVDILNTDRTANAVTIYRKDKGLAWFLDPASRKYTEKKLDGAAWEQAVATMFAAGSQKLGKTGEAQILGYPCDVFQTENNGWTVVSCVGHDTDVILKSEIKKDGQPVQVTEASKFLTEKPADSLFEIPAGYALQKDAE